MRPFKAFVAKSFDPEDERKTRQIEDLLDSFRPLGLQWESAERAEIESVSQKVRQKIDECDVFVGIFTRRHPIFQRHPVPGFNQEIGAPVAWTGPPWLFQESGYALKAGKKLMLFRESQVELPELQGDLEYIPYDTDAPAEAWKKALEVLTALIAQSAGIEVRTSVSVPDAQQTGSDDTNVARPTAPETIEPPSFRQCIDDLIEAECSRDELGIDRAEDSGLQMIRAGGSEHMDEIMWKCQCLASRGRIGDTAAIQKLKEISTEYPGRPDPFWCLAVVAATVGEHKTAGDWYSHAASLDTEKASLRINAATEYRKAWLLDQARKQLDLALAGATATESKAEIMKQFFWTCKESDDPLGAFCFGEAALQLQPNDLDFRFRLAYAYSDVTGGYSQHDYLDLALFHYQRLVGTKAAIEYADNNLGVAYSHFGAPIHATEQYKAASDSGNALGTSNVIRQYLIAGFADEAKAWAQAHATQDDKEGHIARALATVHTLRTAESEKIAEILAGESQHRTALADLVRAPASQESIDGEWRFPLADLKLLVKDREITGAGESTAAGAKTIHTLSASELNGLWRFQIHSRKEADHAGGASRSYSDGGTTALVLEYRPDNSVATYRVSKTSPVPPDGHTGPTPLP